MEEEKVLQTIEEIKAYSDPYRMKILLTFSKFHRPATGKEIADQMHEVPAKVHYHIKKMEKAGILILVNTKIINGIVAKYYEPTAKNYVINSEDIDESSKKVMADETCKMVGHTFDLAKDDFIEILREIKQKNNKYKKGDPRREKLSGTAGYHEVYLSDEQLDEFKKCIDDFFKKHEDKIDGTKKYWMFLSTIEEKREFNNKE